MRTARTLIASLSSTRGLHRHLPCCSLAARRGIYVYRSTLDYYSDYVVFRALLTCTACTFSVSQRWSISSLTVHLICTACTIISWSILLRRLPATWSTITAWITTTTWNMATTSYSSTTSSRLPLGEDLRCGHLLWMPTFFVPIPTERLRTIKPFSGLTVTNCNPCVAPTPSQVMDGTPFPEDRRRKEH